MSEATEMGLMKRILGLLTKPYLAARDKHGLPVKVRHDDLLLLLEPGQSCRAMDLASRCDVTPSAISPVLKELVWAGLVERKPGPDLRSISIELTTDGLATRYAVRRCAKEVNDGMLSVLSADERETLRRILDKLVDGLTKERTTAKGE